MKRRQFFKTLGVGAAVVTAAPVVAEEVKTVEGVNEVITQNKRHREYCGYTRGYTQEDKLRLFHNGDVVYDPDSEGRFLVLANGKDLKLVDFISHKPVTEIPKKLYVIQSHMGG